MARPHTYSPWCEIMSPQSLDWPRHGAASHTCRPHSERILLNRLNWPRHGAASHRRRRAFRCSRKGVSIGRVTARPHTVVTILKLESNAVSELAASRRGLTPETMSETRIRVRRSLNWPRHGAASHRITERSRCGSCLNWPRHGAASHR